MKIYEKIVFDIATGEVLEEISFDYTGPIAEYKGGGGDNEVKETSLEVALSKTTAEEWSRFKTVHQPEINKEAEYYKGLGENEKNAVAGAVNAGAAETYGDVAENTRKAGLSRGIDPSGMAVTMGDVSRDKASTVGNATVRGQSNVDRTKVAGVQNMVGLMRGDAAEAVSGMGSVAANAVADATQEAAYRQSRRNDKFEAGATVAGMGFAAYNNMPQGKPGDIDSASTMKKYNNVGVDMNNKNWEVIG
jgi:hypothetical protein